MMAYKNRGRNGMLAHWPLTAQTRLWAGIAGGIAAVAWRAPLGVGLWVIVASVVSAWPDPTRPSSRGGGFTLEQQERALKVRGFADLFVRPADWTMFGFGPSKTGQEPGGWSPWLRVSAWWALIVAAAAGIPAWLIPYRPVPGWDVLAAPTWTHPLSVTVAVFWFGQCWAGWRRSVADDLETAPAAMLDPAGRRVAVAALPGAAGVGVAAATAVGVVWWRAVGVSPSMFVAAATVGVVVVTARVSRRVVGASTDAWRATLEFRDLWTQIWSAHATAKVPAPFFGVVVPFYGADGEEITHRLASFQVPPTQVWSDYLPFLEKVAAALQTKMVTMAPGPRVNALGQAIPGEIDPRILFVTWLSEPVADTAHLDPKTPDNLRLFVRNWRLQSAWMSLGIAPPAVSAWRRLTSPGAPAGLWEMTLTLPDTVTVGQVARVLPEIARHLRCEWVGIGGTRVDDDSGRDLPSGSVVMVYGSIPDRAYAHLPDRSGRVKHRVEQMRLDGWCRQAGLVDGQGRSLRLLSSTRNDMDLTRMECALPQAMTREMVVKREGELQSASGYGYLAVDLVDLNPTRVALVVGDSDPLDRPWLFVDYEQQLLHEPREGYADIDFGFGIGADGGLQVWSFKGSPHLLCAGSTNRGKSVLMQNAFVQWLHNNGSDDLELWLVEPKTDMFAYQGFELVRRFASNQTDDSIYLSTAAMMNDLVAEMGRRNAEMHAHPDSPKDFAAALEIARREGLWRPDGSKHPLWFPRIILAIEECADLFEDPGKTDEEASEAVKSCQLLAGQLARKARSAGIHLVLVTQRPTKNAVPAQVKGQCGRIGLGVEDTVSSLVILDSPVLEGIVTKGRGFWKSDVSGTAPYRSLFLPDDGEDRTRILAGCPRRVDGAAPVQPVQQVLQIPVGAGMAPPSDAVPEQPVTSPSTVEIDGLDAFFDDF